MPAQQNSGAAEWKAREGCGSGQHFLQKVVAALGDILSTEQIGHHSAFNSLTPSDSLSVPTHSVCSTTNQVNGSIWRKDSPGFLHQLGSSFTPLVWSWSVNEQITQLLPTVARPYSQNEQISYFVW